MQIDRVDPNLGMALAWIIQEPLECGITNSQFFGSLSSGEFAQTKALSMAVLMLDKFRPLSHPRPANTFTLLTSSLHARLHQVPMSTLHLGVYIPDNLGLRRR